MLDQLNQVLGFLHGMWRYRWSALVVTWIVAMVGWAAVYALPNQYEAKAVVFIDTDSVMKPLLKGLAVESDSFDEIAVMSRVLLSRDNLLSLIRETDMDLQVDTPVERLQLMEVLAKKIKLKGGGTRGRKKNNIYEISYTDTSAEHVYQVVSSLLNTLIESTLSSGRTDSIKAQEFLDKQISEHEDRLTEAEQRLAGFKKKNVGLMPDERGGYYSRFQLALTDVRNTGSDLRLAKRRLSELKNQLQSENPILGGRSASNPKVSQLDVYRAQLSELLSRYTEEHPDVQALILKIENFKKSGAAGVEPSSVAGAGATTEYNPVYQELKVEISKASVDVETLKIKLSEKEERVEELKKSVDAIPEVEAELSKLNRDYEITRERYLNLVERRESARLGQAVGKSGGEINFRIIEPPVVPILPAGPNRLRFLAIALILSLGAGLGWSFLRDQLKPTFINIDQLSSSTEIPVLGSVSLFLTPQHQRKRRLQLASFCVGIVLLMSVFGSVAWFHDKGSAVMRGMIAEVSL